MILGLPGATALPLGIFAIRVNAVGVHCLLKSFELGSCWAFGSAEVITDRICIASNGTQSPVISAEDILSCCSTYYDDCGSCDGGWPYNAFNYWNAAGIVTGGDYGSDVSIAMEKTNNQGALSLSSLSPSKCFTYLIRIFQVGCMPYEISPCGKHDGVDYGPCPKESPPTPKCAAACRQGYPTSYLNDKTFGTSSYRIKTNSAIDIQREILVNGPVVTCYDLYADFYNYKSGVYVVCLYFLKSEG